MYLSRMELDLTRRETMKALAAPSRFHGAIERAFSGERKRNLWRLDHLNGRHYLMLLSMDPPDLTAAAAQFGFPGADLPWETRDYDLFLQRITEGSRWQFRLTANPTVSRARESGRGRVFAHITPHFQKQWLLDRSARHGFTLEEDNFQVVYSRWQRFSKGGGPMVSILMVTFEGVLTVRDPSLLRQALTEGIGRGKAYGMGLLTLMQPREADHGG